MIQIQQSQLMESYFTEFRRVFEFTDAVALQVELLNVGVFEILHRNE